MKKIKLEIEDGLINSIGVSGGWTTFRSDEGDEITLERVTLERGLACEKIDEKILEDIMEAKKFMATPGIHQAIPRDLMVRVDSLLSCLVHRHGSVLDQINETEEVKELAEIIQKYTR